MRRRLGITGGPKTGKTTLALELGRLWGWAVFHADDVSGLAWVDQPGEIIKRAPVRGIIEGVQVARAVRKGLELDRLVVLDFPLTVVTDRQLAMSRGLDSVLASMPEYPYLRFSGPSGARSYLEDWVNGDE